MDASFNEFRDLNLRLNDLLHESNGNADPYRRAAPADDAQLASGLAFPAVAAAHLGLSEERAVEIFGLRWAELDTSEWESHQQLDVFDAGGHWFISGEPAQLMARPVDGGVELASPKGDWSSQQLLMGPSNRVMLDLEEVEERGSDTVASLLRKRRATFRYCNYCRALTPPEERFALDCCYGCASTVHSLVY